MGIFSELCGAYSNSEGRKLQFFRKLNDQTRHLRDGFSKYVESPTGKYSTDDGEVPYVRLLAWQDGQYEEPSGMLISRLDDDLVGWFGLSLAVEHDANSWPKSVYRSLIGLKWLPDAMEVHLPEMDRVIVAPRVDDDKTDYSAVYQSIVEGIHRQLAFDPFEGRSAKAPR
ncbi:hypothetical protein [Pandoraea terrigena]|uniref:Uncharacterized protein n=1 Tax=Pandoraea terrigena TaxID=2508292 RepID=A0A5E4YCL0_9BURK|nr:hypothetical protein [Pandoraea terrigena]VVE46177.1 hypothetical protein PTE31013_04445 [Pandoraea terrigena]